MMRLLGWLAEVPREVMTQMSVGQGLIDLVSRFNRNRDAYHSPACHETQLRREFVDPVGALLGWDVENRHGYAEEYKHVIHEVSIRVGGATEAPDYRMRAGG